MKQEISVKSLPLINSKERAKLSGNITVIEIINDWARIENDVENGWIRKNTLKSMVTITEQVPPEQDEQEQRQEQPEEETYHCPVRRQRRCGGGRLLFPRKRDRCPGCQYDPAQNRHVLHCRRLRLRNTGGGRRHQMRL